MKKLKYLLLALTLLVCIPFAVYAEETETSEETKTEEKTKINVYMFYGDGCPHCAEAEEFFSSIENSYGKYYNLVTYETWNDQDNQTLMEETAEKYGDEVNGVPYILIGEKTWNGYASDMDSEIKKAIKTEYEKSPEDRTDYINAKVKDSNTKTGYASDIISVIIIIIVVGAVVGLLMYTRKKTK